MKNSNFELPFLVILPLPWYNSYGSLGGGGGNFANILKKGSIQIRWVKRLSLDFDL